MKTWQLAGLAMAGLWGLGQLTDTTTAPEGNHTNSLLLQETSHRPQQTLYVTGDVVNVRSGPSTSYQRVAQVRQNDWVQVLAIENGWAKIVTQNGNAWMSAKYLSQSRPQKVKTVRTAQKPKAQCHPSYQGRCVPFASDVDCAGGRGNGPAYVRGPVRVVGRDVYRLDRDGDGVACE